MTLTAVVMLALAACHACAQPPARITPQPPPVSEKEQRTPAQQKIDSQLLYELYRLRGEARKKGVPEGPTGVRIDARQRALVDIRAEVTGALERKVRSIGGEIESVSAPYRSIIAWIPLKKLEGLAADRAVQAISPKAEAAIR